MGHYFSKMRNSKLKELCVIEEEIIDVISDPGWITPTISPKSGVEPPRHELNAPKVAHRSKRRSAANQGKSPLKRTELDKKITESLHKMSRGGEPRASPVVIHQQS